MIRVEWEPYITWKLIKYISVILVPQVQLKIIIHCSASYSKSSQCKCSAFYNIKYKQNMNYPN